MNELLATLPDINGRPRGDGRPGAGFVLLDDHYRDERKKRRVEGFLNSWPILVGGMMAVFAPFLAETVAPFKPWGTFFLFPFVALVGRPEIHLGARFMEIAPQVMLYLQFPLEGWLAKKFLKSRVTFSGVAGQVFLYHFLGVVQVLLVYRALGDGVIH